MPASSDNKHSTLTHFDSSGKAHIVNVSQKEETHRVALAKGSIRMKPQTLDLVRNGMAEKGDVLGLARTAGIMGAKKTSDLIPLCHPLALTHVSLDFAFHDEEPGISCEARVETVGKTGVEMEALTAVQTALLTIYDMLKAADRGMVITNVRLARKSGGQSGDWAAGSE